MFNPWSKRFPPVNLTRVKISFWGFIETKGYFNISILVLSSQKGDKYEWQSYNFLRVFESCKSCDQKLARLRGIIFSRIDLLITFLWLNGWYLLIGMKVVFKFQTYSYTLFSWWVRNLWKFCRLDLNNTCSKIQSAHKVRVCQLDFVQAFSFSKTNIVVCLKEGFLLS